MPSSAFPPQVRLRDSAAYRAVFSGGRKFVSSGFVIIVAPGQTDGARLGLALAKRRIRRAVDRNRVKRVLRESFRSTREQLGAIDIVVLARSRTATMNNSELFSQLAELWPRIARSYTVTTAAPGDTDPARQH